MGKQILVAMSNEDEQEFLSFLNSGNNIVLIETFAETEELLWKSNFTKEVVGHFNYYIWNNKFLWEPQYKRSVNGQYYISNTKDAPLIRFSRSIIDSNNYGRIYWAKDFAAPNGLNYDVDVFEQWYDQIVKWVKKKSGGKLNDGRITYFLPKAWELYNKSNI